MSNTLDDFFGDGSVDNIPECSFCGKAEGELIVSIQDAYGPTHWHHAACKIADDAKKGTSITPTWDEAMSQPSNTGAELDGYEMKEWYESVNHPNDHLMFTVFSKEDGCPVDFFKIYREGDRYFVRGQWKGYAEAQEWTAQVLGQWF